MRVVRLISENYLHFLSFLLLFGLILCVEGCCPKLITIIFHLNFPLIYQITKTENHSEEAHEILIVHLFQAWAQLV